MSRGIYRIVVASPEIEPFIEAGDGSNCDPELRCYYEDCKGSAICEGPLWGTGGGPPPWRGVDLSVTQLEMLIAHLEAPGASFDFIQLAETIKQFLRKEKL